MTVCHFGSFIADRQGFVAGGKLGSKAGREGSNPLPLPDRREAKMAIGPLKLYWKKRLVGVINAVAWSDFPWASGRFEPRQLPRRLREVLEWFADQAEAAEPADPPFDADLVENWAIAKPDRSRVELLLPPIVDFDNGFVEWRE